MDAQDIGKLKTFIQFVQAKPDILHAPEFAFFKDYLASMGATVPPPSKSDGAAGCPFGGKADSAANNPNEPKPAAEPQEPESDPESDVELDMSGVIAEDEDLCLEMGDVGKEPSDEDMEKLGEIRGQAQEAMSEGNHDAALKLWTEAIEVNPQSAVLFAKRAQVLVKMDKPNNAIKDASRAIELNPDQPLAFRIRGRAHRLLGHWEEAASDLNTSLKIDYSEDANDWLKEVSANAKKLHDHKRKCERKREEKLLRERQERIKRAQEERERAAKEAASGMGAGMGGQGFSMPGGAGGMPGGMGEALGGLLNDPDILEAFSDPEVAAAFQDISSNPANMMKYQGNPKVMALMNKMMQKMGGGGGMGGGIPGSMGGGMPGGMGNMFG